jgi:iron complex transport system ATP-binding protein
MIRFERVGVRRGRRWIFRELSLALRPGTCLAILGPNGRGKTTLIKTAVGLLAATEGRRVAPDLIGYVPQSAGAFLPYRALDIVVMGRAQRLGVFGVPARSDYAAAEAALERVGALAFAAVPFERLSGGERQLVLLARALATGAQTILLDEPASALDLANQDRLLGVLSDLRREARYAVAFSTHLPSHALHVADEALLMYGPSEHVQGPVDMVLSEVNLTRLYGVPVRRVSLTPTSRTAVEAVVPLFGLRQSA